MWLYADKLVLWYCFKNVNEQWCTSTLWYVHIWQTLHTNNKVVHVCASFHTIGVLGFGAERPFSIQTDKTQRHSGAACFHVLWTKCVPPVGLRVGQVLCLQYPFSLDKDYYYTVMHRQRPIKQAAFSETMHAWTHGKITHELSIIWKRPRTHTTEPTWLPGWLSAHFILCVMQLAV